MGSCGAQKVSISQSCSEAHWRGQGYEKWLTYSTWAQSASPNQQLQCHGAPKETPKLLIYFYLLKSSKWATQLIFPSISPSPPPSWGNWWCGGSTRLFLSGISLSSHSLWNHPMLSPAWCHPHIYLKETLWGPTTFIPARHHTSRAASPNFTPVRKIYTVELSHR